MKLDPRRHVADEPSRSGWRRSIPAQCDRWSVFEIVLSERHGRDGAIDLVLRPEGDGSWRGARNGDIGALARLVQNLLTRRVRHAHDALDKENAEHLVADRATPEFRSADADGCKRRRHAGVGARQFRQLSREKSEGARHPEFENAAARRRIENVPVQCELCLLAKRQPRVVGESDFQPCRFAGRYDLVREDGSIQPERSGGAAARAADLALYAADRTDRVLSLGRFADEAAKKSDCNDDQPIWYESVRNRLGNMDLRNVGTYPSASNWADSDTMRVCRPMGRRPLLPARRSLAIAGHLSSCCSGASRRDSQAASSPSSAVTFDSFACHLACSPNGLCKAPSFT